MKGPEDTIAEDAPSLLDLLGVILRRRVFIAVFCCVVVLVAFAFVLVSKLLPATSPLNLFPDYYRPTVRVLIRERSQDNPLSSALTQGLGSISGLLGLTTAGIGTLDKLAESLLTEGYFIPDTIASEFGFAEKYGLTVMVKTGARRTFLAALSSRFNDKSGIMTIGYRDVDPEFATRVVNRIVELLESQLNSLTLDRVVQKKRYLEDSMAAVEAEYRRVSGELTAFQSKYGIFDISQVSESIKQIASLQSQVITKQLAIATLRGQVPETDPRIVQYRNEITQMEKLIDEMKKGSQDYSLGLVAANQVPGVSAQYLAIQRDVQIQQSILATLKQQYEIAKLEERDTSQTFQVVEKAERPEVKDGPRRAVTLLFVAVGALFISILIAFVIEYFDRAGRDPVESGKLAFIRETLRGFFRRKRR